MSKFLCFMIGLMLITAGCAYAADEFYIGQWCGPLEKTQASFAEAADAGFNVLWVSGKTVEEKQLGLELCQANGVRGMIVDERPQVRRNSKNDINDLTKSIKATVKDYSKYPALWGYYVIDEPSAVLYDKIAFASNYFLKKDPRHIPFVNLLPTYASSEQLGRPDYKTYVDDFMKTVRPKVLSFDHYTLFKDTAKIRDDYFENMGIIRDAAVKYNVPFHSIILSVPHECYRDPSLNDLRWEVYTALAYGAKGIMYFTYGTPRDPVFKDAIIGLDGKPTAKYAYAKQINAEIKALGPTLLKLHSTGVYHTGSIPRGAEKLQSGNLLDRIEDGDFIIGEFVSNNGDKYAMIVNRSLDKTVKAKVVFSHKVILHELSPIIGAEEPVAVNDETTYSAFHPSKKFAWSAAFKPGQGRLVRVEQVGGLPIDL
ncbi:MAG: hypothetical protein ABFD83_07210 [Armatimonadota bacterium]